ncbi:hypothetical protein WME76_41755 [Sorangium sp. So ce119]|uniref:hypothetical protein n=1 Tax=Sorangium sp. So ce119 TaxID=3133279 RepID=UPI003F637088
MMGILAPAWGDMTPGVVAPGSYRVHFEGYDAQWDEVVTEARIKGGARPGSGQKAAVPAASSSER